MLVVAGSLISKIKLIESSAFAMRASFVFILFGLVLSLGLAQANEANDYEDALEVRPELPRVRRKLNEKLIQDKYHRGISRESDDADDIDEAQDVEAAGEE